MYQRGVVGKFIVIRDMIELIMLIIYNRKDEVYENTFIFSGWF